MRTEDGYFISKCLDGDSAAFGFLVDKYKACVYALAYSRLRNFHDAEDATQEVFLTAYRKLNTLRRYDNFRAWLYSITSNYCKMHFRSQDNRPDSVFVEDNPPDILDNHSIELQRESLADEINNELIEMLDKSLVSLPETYRQVLTLRYLGNMSNYEIAQFLGISQTAIRQRLTRARTELKEGMLAMMSKTFEQKSLPASFTFNIVEVVKQIKIQPISLTKGLSLGLSLATGLMIAFLGIGQHINLSEPMDIFTASRLSGEAKVLEVGEFPVDIMDISKIPSLSSLSGNGDGVGSVVPSLQNALFMAPQAGDTWTKKADMPTARTQFATAVVNGKIYAIGGIKIVNGNFVPLSTVEEYDPIEDKWTIKKNMPTPRMINYSVSVVDGIIYAIGGADEIGTTVEAYDPIKDKWTVKTNMPTPRMNFCTEVVNGLIYAIGGVGAGGANFGKTLSAVEEYDPVKDTWTKKSDMPTPRDCFSAKVFDNKIYILGGENSGGDNFGPAIPEVLEYDPIADRWTKKSNMPTPRIGSGAVLVDNKIYTIGGFNGGQMFTIVEIYDPASDTWTKGVDIITARAFPCCCAVDGKIYVIGGYTGVVISSVEEYDTGFRDPKSVEPNGKLPKAWGKIKSR
jgi:RNA polymerase sigma factor (sigma-70 family)